ncbi:MAG: Hsp70 family protein, partial [Myxococcales bacterium]|nr:Hsp70 family protein [Myxococcales bacterium]
RHLVAQMVGEFYDEHGYDLADSPSALQRLWEAARLAKHELSTAHTANRIELPHVTRIGGVPQHLSRAGFEREELDALAREEIERLAGPCRWVLEDSGMASEDIDEVLLVGGASRLPVVSDALDQLFHGRVRTAPQAEQMVAEGAARRAGLLRGELSGPHLHDVATVSLGIKVGEGRFRAIVERNQPIPRVETKRFQPTSGDYHRMVFELYQGEADLATENIYLGRLELRDVSGPVEVAFAVDDSGLLSLTAETADRVSPPPSLSVQWSGGLLDEERDQLRIAASAPPKPARPATPTRVERSVSPAPPNERPGETARPAAPMPAAIPLAPFRVKGKERPTAPTIPGTPIRGDTAHRDGPHRDGHRDGAPGSPPSSRPPQHSRPPSSPRDSLPAPAGPMAVEADSLLGATLGGRYLIEAVVAEGGMGRVYRAKHEVLGRRFAIKVLHAELASNSEIADRFVREAQAASMIDSPHVVDISDFGRLEDGTGFFVMEFLSGKTLADHIEAKGALPLGELLDIGIQLTKGLAAAHALDIIHRDLKPENITLIERGGHRFCKIVDFGIAKSPTSDTNKRLTLAGTLLGTPHYMAPEQIDGEDVDARSDLYALGAVLFEMATGRTVFEADTVVNLLVHHKITPAPRATSLAPQPIPEALDDLIASCLSKSPEERPASAKDVGEQLQAMLERDH